jgi:pilus assembly protein CpaB
MSPRTIVTFAVAIMLGLFAVLLVRNYVSPKRTDSAGKANATIVVAAQPIKRGDKLDPASLKVVRVPADALPAGAFNSVAALTGDGVERVALRAIALNEPILPAGVSGPGGRAIMSSSVADGMRAVSLRSNDVAGVAGFVLPGDHVDVLLTRDSDKGDGSVVTQLLADNILVLGVDQTNDGETDKPKVAKAVTVQVTPDQAQAIALAQRLGSVSLALRSVVDSGAPMKKATTVADLAYGARPAARPAQINRVRTSAPAKPAAASLTQTVHVTRGVNTAGYEVAAR